VTLQPSEDGADGTVPVRLRLPAHLRGLARVDGEVHLEVVPPVSVQSVLDALETRFPVLRGAIRAHGGGPRRPFVRFFACQEDWSHEPMDAPLPPSIAEGEEPLLVVGAMAGG
jgi:hypothetical protein